MALRNGGLLLTLCAPLWLLVIPVTKLLVHGWLEITRPIVFVFTDGSGRSTNPGCLQPPEFLTRLERDAGAFMDDSPIPEAYAAILNHDHDLFIDLARELSEALIVDESIILPAMRVKEYNPMHDVCRLGN